MFFPYENGARTQPPVAGALCWSADLFFLRRMKKKTPMPMSARPTMGPMTAPAIYALLFSGSGVEVGEVIVGVDEDVVIASEDDGVAVGDPGIANK